jgi:hypothetical protein
MSCRLREAELKPSCQEQAAGRAISLTKPAPTLKRSFRSACISPMPICCGASKRHWLESGEAHSACARPASNRSPKRDWKPCPGRVFVASARSRQRPERPLVAPRANHALSAKQLRDLHGEPSGHSRRAQDEHRLARRKFRAVRLGIAKQKRLDSAAPPLRCGLDKRGRPAYTRKPESEIPLQT